MGFALEHGRVEKITPLTREIAAVADFVECGPAEQVNDPFDRVVPRLKFGVRGEMAADQPGAGPVVFKPERIRMLHVSGEPQERSVKRSLWLARCPLWWQTTNMEIDGRPAIYAFPHGVAATWYTEDGIFRLGTLMIYDDLGCQAISRDIMRRFQPLVNERAPIG